MGLSNVYVVPGPGKGRGAAVIDGKAISAAEREAVAGAVDDSASAVYVGSKIRACAEVGMGRVHHHLSADVSARKPCG